MAKKRVLKVNMKGVESGGTRRFPEGDYRVKIAKVETGKESQKGNPQAVVHFDLLEGPKDSGTVRDYITLTESALWRLGNLLDALGIKWSQKQLEIPLNKMEGKELGITLTDDEYNGKIKSKVSDYLDLETIKGILDGSDDEDEDEDEDDEDDEDEDEDDEDDEPDLDSLDRDELKALIKERKLDVKVKKSMNEKQLRKAIREALDEDDEDEDEDLEELDVDEEL